MNRNSIVKNLLDWPGGPDFFIVGAPKCGTTAMNDYLAAHPEIFMAAKEPHYFAPELSQPHSYYLSAQNYRKMFARRRNEKIAGESSVFYLYSREAAQRIREYRNDARIIIMLRNPVDVIPSYHSQLLFNCEEDIHDLELALAAETRRRRAPRPRGRRRPAPVLYYRQVVRFAEQVERYLQTFGRELVHVIIFDDFKADAPAVYSRVLEFLGVDPTFRPSFSVVNPNKVARSESLLRLVKYPPARLQKLARSVLPHRALTGLRRTVTRTLTRHAPRPPMSPHLRRQLQQELRDDVERLSSLLDRDLTVWCRAESST